MKRKIFVLLIFLSLIIIFTISCNKLKYPPGKDTIELFGDGTYQIVECIDKYSLINNQNNTNVENDIDKYRIWDKKVFIAGESGYTMIMRNIK